MDTQPLSHRELEIARLILDGFTNHEIAARLVLTHGTVKWYCRQIYGKLGVTTRVQAIGRLRDVLKPSEPQPSGGGPLHTPSHLPTPLTSFIGREYEIAHIRNILGKARLLTVTGTGGTGKTRLAIAVAGLLRDDFENGVHFISFATLTDAGLVAQTAAMSLGVPRIAGQPIVQSLQNHLRDRELLLVIDNFEHVLPAASFVGELLAVAPRLKILVTSREPLHLYGEHEFPVPPLTLPGDEGDQTPGRLLSYEAIALFVARAQAINPAFVLNDEAASSVLQICRRLDGLPLAIELAAVRTKLMSIRALLARLERRFELLATEMPNVPPRHRTLRAAIDWSYDLLNDGERLLFSRMAVFRSGVDVDAIVHICGAGLPIPGSEAVESLMDKNLLRRQVQADGEARFLMLETIRAYAWERLGESGDLNTMRGNHAAYFVNLAERAAPQLRQADQFAWLQQLEMAQDNLHAALEWSFAGGDNQTGLRLVAALVDFWSFTSRFIEGEKWISCAVSALQDAPLGLRAQVLTRGCILLYFSSQHGLAKAYLDEALMIYRSIADPLHKAWAKILRGGVEIGNAKTYAPAIQSALEGLNLFRELGDKPGIIQGLNIIGELARTHGDDDRAEAAYMECLTIAQATGDKRRVTCLIENLGHVAMHRGDFKRAEMLFRQSLVGALQLKLDRHLVVNCFAALAGAIAANGDPAHAARLYGAVETALQEMGIGLSPGNISEYEHNLRLLHERLRHDNLTALWKEGRGQSLEFAIGSSLMSDRDTRITTALTGASPTFQPTILH